MLQLWHACRAAKEALFANPKAKSQPVTVLGRGRKVVGGAIRAELERELLEKTLVDGFFPIVGLDESPRRERGVGLQELGLAYAADPAITRHIASFLTRHGEELRTARGDGSRAPTAILFNGGVFQAAPLRQRIIDQLSQWGQKDSAAIRELPSVGMDLAVARGAAYYGLVKRGKGVRIRGGVARSYYIGVEAALPAVPGMRPPIKALCVVPQGTEEGTELELPGREFGLVLGQEVEFRFLGSTQRKQDAVGAIVEDWEDSIEELAPIHATLPAESLSGAPTPVRLRAKVTEVGTLELWFQKRDGSDRWKLEFNVRESSGA
jgi:hypothetical protein